MRNPQDEERLARRTLPAKARLGVQVSVTPDDGGPARALGWFTHVTLDDGRALLDPDSRVIVHIAPDGGLHAVDRRERLREVWISGGGNNAVDVDLLDGRPFVVDDVTIKQTGDGRAAVTWAPLPPDRSGHPRRGPAIARGDPRNSRWDVESWSGAVGERRQAAVIRLAGTWARVARNPQDEERLAVRGRPLPPGPWPVVDGDSGQVDCYGEAMTREDAILLANDQFADEVVDAYAARDVQCGCDRGFHEVAWVAVVGPGRRPATIPGMGWRRRQRGAGGGPSGNPQDEERLARRGQPAPARPPAPDPIVETWGTIVARGAGAGSHPGPRVATDHGTFILEGFRGYARPGMAVRVRYHPEDQFARWVPDEGP